MSTKKRKNTSYLLCKLTDQYSLFASKNSFVIKEEIKGNDESTWIGKYFYSDLSDALRGHLRHMLRSKKTAKKVNGDIKILADELKKIENDLHEFCKRFEEDLMNRLRDPVELSLLQNAMEVSSNES